LRVPTCRKCQTTFANRIEIDRVVRNVGHRKYCLRCSPFNAHNTHALENKPEGPVKCATCRKTYTYDHTKGHGWRNCNSCIAGSRRTLVKQRAADLLGGKCLLCRYNNCLSALQFHHKDPRTKLFEVSTNTNRSWEAIKKEVKKCVLLCSNCHTEVHAGMHTDKGL